MRTCIVDGEGAYFHTWSSESHYIPGRGIITSPVGIVEFLNGEVKCVEPEDIRFVDRKEDE